MNKIYINVATHISAQKPLSEEWFSNPIVYQEDKVVAIDLNYKDYLSPNEARRMKKLLKRALVCARTAMECSDTPMPDAIITATGLGCIENTEIFLDAMAREGEKLLNPTPFMQSTHNTIGSAIGLDIKCHGYNTHYSQKYASFDCGLQDAFMQLQNENIQTVLLNAHDEHSPIFDSILKHLDCWHFNGGFKGEVAVSMMLAKRPTEKTLCCINDMAMSYKPSIDVFQQELQTLLQRNALSINDIDAVFVGVNGNEKNDSVYLAYADALFPNLPLVRYKHLFGEHFTASALGVYAAATCLQQGRIPMDMRQLDVRLSDMRCETVDNPISRILFYNHSENKEHTIILLTNEKQ